MSRIRAFKHQSGRRCHLTISIVCYGKSNDVKEMEIDRLEILVYAPYEL